MLTTHRTKIKEVYLARHKASKKVKGPRAPNQLMALRKRFRKKGKLIDYHGTQIPLLPEGKHRREVMQMTRAWQERKRKALKADA